jgi:putative transposase
LCYPQSGFSLQDNTLCLSKIGKVQVKLHREVEGSVKTCTLKKNCRRRVGCHSIL